MNFVMTGSGKFIEVQGTAESAPFTSRQMERMSEIAQQGIKELLKAQKKVITPHLPVHHRDSTSGCHHQSRQICRGRSLSQATAPGDTFAAEPRNVIRRSSRMARRSKRMRSRKRGHWRNSPVCSLWRMIQAWKSMLLTARPGFIPRVTAGADGRTTKRTMTSCLMNCAVCRKRNAPRDLSALWRYATPGSEPNESLDSARVVRGTDYFRTAKEHKRLRLRSVVFLSAVWQDLRRNRPCKRKATVSHRGKALKKVAELLPTVVDLGGKP